MKYAKWRKTNTNDFTHLWSIRTKEKLKEQNTRRLTEPKNGPTVTKGKETGEDEWEGRDKGEKGVLRLAHII